jgi:hypothetical protein
MTTCSKIDDLRARSTCEQDRSVCVILHISSWRYGCIVTFFWCINDDCNLCVCVCVILHLKRHACVIISVQYNSLYDLPTHLQAWRRTSWRGLANPCLFWCNLCVWFCISRDMLVWLSLCSTIFCMIYLLTCKAWRTSRRGLANSSLFWCNLFAYLAHNKGDAGSLVLVSCP